MARADEIVVIGLWKCREECGIERLFLSKPSLNLWILRTTTYDDNMAAIFFLVRLKKKKKEIDALRFPEITTVDEQCLISWDT